jgi:glycosyltransferase involved in cell wall biosynthesis
MAERERARSEQRVSRVALVIGQLTIGGAEGQLLQVVRGLNARFEPLVISLSEGDGGVRTALAETGVPVHVIGGRGLSRTRKLVETLKAQRVDLVHAWLFIANGYVLGARLLGAPQPIITSARNCKIQGRMSQLANALAFRISESIVVNSSEVEAYIRRHYWAPAGRIRMVHNGVDTERFRPASEDDVAADGGAVIVTIGRLVHQKNHELFLQAAARLLRVLPQTRFVIVGDGPLRHALRARAEALGVAGAVTFSGESSEVDSILRRATLLWLTSRWEGMPNVVLEALASGVPVVATDVGGTRELIRCGEDGFIVPSGGVEEFVQRTLLLLRDPRQLARFRGAARRRALEFSTERMIASLSKVYEEALG